MLTFLFGYCFCLAFIHSAFSILIFCHNPLSHTANSSCWWRVLVWSNQHSNLCHLPYFFALLPQTANSPPSLPCWAEAQLPPSVCRLLWTCQNSNRSDSAAKRPWIIHWRVKYCWWQTHFALPWNLWSLYIHQLGILGHQSHSLLSATIHLGQLSTPGLNPAFMLHH